MKSFTLYTLALLSLVSLAPTCVRAEDLILGQSSRRPEPEAPQRDAFYKAGVQAMDESRWSDAVTAFDKSITSRPDSAEAALYWKAYSLQKLGRKDEATATCDKLRTSRPASDWNRECSMMRAQSALDLTKLRVLGMRQEDLDLGLAYSANGNNTFTYLTGSSRSRTTTEDDIRLLALNSLMRSDPAKAMPVLRDILRSDKPIAMRKQALFILSRSKQPEAQTLLTEVATNKSSPELQRAAIETISLGRGKEAGPMLADIYRNSSDTSVKRAAVNGLWLTHDATRLVDLARGEKDLSLKRDIVSQLALMKDQIATDYMLELLR